MTFFVASPLDGLLITLYHPLMTSNALANSWVAQQLILTQLTPVWKYTSHYEIQFFWKTVFISIDRDLAKQELCLRNSLLCLATTYKSFEGGAELSSLVWFVCISIFVFMCLCVFTFKCLIVYLYLCFCVWQQHVNHLKAEQSCLVWFVCLFVCFSIFAIK